MLVKEISQQFQKSIARTPYCCHYVVRRYSIARLLRENRVGCCFGDLTDSRRVESKSSYSANRRREIEIFRKRVSTGSRYRSEIAYYFATRSRFLIAVKKGNRCLQHDNPPVHPPPHRNTSCRTATQETPSRSPLIV